VLSTDEAEDASLHAEAQASGVNSIEALSCLGNVAGLGVSVGATVATGSPFAIMTTVDQARRVIDACGEPAAQLKKELDKKRNDDWIIIGIVGVVGLGLLFIASAYVGHRAAKKMTEKKMESME
jgi:hypothetical protein